MKVVTGEDVEMNAEDMIIRKKPRLEKRMDMYEVTLFCVVLFCCW